MWLAAVGSIAGVEKQTPNPRRLAGSTGSCCWHLSWQTVVMPRGSAHRFPLLANSRCSISGVWRPPAWGTAVSQSGLDEASFLFSAPLPQFANEAVAWKWMRRGETFPRRQFCQLTVINDFDTLQQAGRSGVLYIRGWVGLLVIHVWQRAHAGRETGLGLKTTKGVKLEKLASLKVVSPDKTRMVKDKQNTLGAKVKKMLQRGLIKFHYNTDWLRLDLHWFPFLSASRLRSYVQQIRYCQITRGYHCIY